MEKQIVSLDVARAMESEREGRARAILKQQPEPFREEEPGVCGVWLYSGGHGNHRVSLASCDCPDYAIWASRLPAFKCKHMMALKMWIQEKTEQQEKKEKKMEETTTTGWVKLYHPTAGVQCTIPLPLNGTLTAQAASSLLEEVAALIDAGWLVNQPGLEGETREAVSSLVRRRANETDVIDVYCGAGQYKTLHVYMNDADDYAEFEKAFGQQVGKLPLWEGDTPIKRSERPDRDAKYLVNVTTAGVDVVWTLNPKYEGEGDKKHQKRSFVRWECRQRRVVERPSPSEVVEANLNAQYYKDGTLLDEGNENEVKAFNEFLASQGRPPESRAALREFFKARARN